MYRLLPAKIWLILFWFILVLVGLAARPLFPVDETRYASVAWEMWHKSEFLVPHLNGETYSHKPPLLFWLMQASWWLFGVNDWSLRWISPLFALGSLFLTQAIAQKLWPDDKKTKVITPFLLLGTFVWIAYNTLTMFDMLLAFFVLLGIYSLLLLTRDSLNFKNWSLLALAIGGGVMSKGPVILLHLLPLALTAPWWHKNKSAEFYWKHWYGGLALAVLGGALIALCWAIPAGIAGGETYRNAIFLGQTSGRLVKSFAHQLPWWWYLEKLPLFLLPWLFFRPLWSGLRNLNWQDPGLRFCLAWIGPVFIAFSLVSGKRLHYLLPLFPAFALILAKAVTDSVDESRWQRAHLIFSSLLLLIGLVLLLLPWLNNWMHWRPEIASLSPVWGGLLMAFALLLTAIKAENKQTAIFYGCIASVTALLIISSGYFSVAGFRYDTKPAAEKIAALMADNHPVAYFSSKYHGQYQFTGRLEQPLELISSHQELQQWAEKHPDGFIITVYPDSTPILETLLYAHYPYKGQNVGVVSAQTLLTQSTWKALLKP